MTKATNFLPVSSPDLGELEERYVSEAMRSGWISSIGPFVDRFERGFADYCGVAHGVAMTNGTDALFIALKALGIGPGDEVIVPALTFVAVPAVVAHLAADPVIVDVDPESWCLDPAAVERALTPRTKAIVVVHVYGHPANMDPILDLARNQGIRVIEDCAEAHGAKYKGRSVGSLADVGCFSFYGNKILTTGEGGMSVTDDGELAARMRFLKDHAMDPERRYYHPEAGFNCRMTNVQAAIGCAQLERIDTLQERRHNVLDGYREGLADLPGLSLNPSAEWADPVSWMVCAVLQPELSNARDQLLVQLRERGIDSRPFFAMAQSMPPYAGCRVVGRQQADTPVAKRLSVTGFNLPSSPQLEPSDVARVTDALRALLSSL